nr:MAG TPA: Ectodermal ciliogenesis protein [Caudoviricetes sp.]
MRGRSERRQALGRAALVCCVCNVFIHLYV